MSRKSVAGAQGTARRGAERGEVMSRSHGKSLCVVACICVVLASATACGSRRDHAAFQAAAGVKVGATERVPAPGETIGESGAPEEGLVAPAPAPAGARSGSEPTVRTGGTLAKSAAPPAGVTSPQTGGDGKSPQVGKGQPAPSATGRAGSTIRLGNVSDMSGPVGAVNIGGVKVLQAWVQAVNARGGVVDRDGIRHPVALTVADARSSPSQHHAATQELVESRGVVALLDNMDPVSVHGSTRYLTEKRIPSIGNLSGNDAVIHGNWIYFPIAPSLSVYAYGTVQAAKRFVGGKRLGILYCQEAAGCGEVARKMADAAPANGYEVVYQAAVSIAQPDFTAQCLAARNAGVEVMASALDNNSQIRLASQCARQGFTPKYAPVNYDDRMGQYPEYAGSVFPIICFPFAHHGPETAEFHDTLTRYPTMRDTPQSVTSVCAWSGAKLFEKAISGISGEITNESILASLWTLKNETLGGLTPAFTFSKEKPVTVQPCIYSMVVRDKQFVAPIGMSPICRPA